MDATLIDDLGEGAGGGVHQRRGGFDVDGLCVLLPTFNVAFTVTAWSACSTTLLLRKVAKPFAVTPML
jgi:hypothetical protein